MTGEVTFKVRFENYSFEFIPKSGEVYICDLDEHYTMTVKVKDLIEALNIFQNLEKAENE